MDCGSVAINFRGAYARDGWRNTMPRRAAPCRTGGYRERRANYSHRMCLIFRRVRLYTRSCIIWLFNGNSSGDRQVPNHVFTNYDIFTIFTRAELASR